MSFGDPGNPYSTPTPGSMGQGNRVDVKGKLMGPGIALLVVGILGFLSMGSYFVLTVIGLSMEGGQQLEPPPGADEAARMGFFVGAYGMIALLAIQPLTQLFVIWGGVNFLRQQGRGMAYFACILSVIPCFSSCCIFGIPFGIWGLIVLADPAVKRAMS